MRATTTTRPGPDQIQSLLGVRPAETLSDLGLTNSTEPPKVFCREKDFDSVRKKACLPRVASRETRGLRTGNIS